MANTNITRTPSSTGNRKTFTFSTWFKKTSTGAIGNLFSQYAGSGSGADKHFRVRFNTNDTIGVAAFSTDVLVTNRVFRDTSAWYHLTLAVDTTQATDSNRVKLYINGTQETSFSSTSYPSQNYDYAVNTASYPIRIGADDSDGNGPYGWFNGIMAHVHLTDGTAYAASTFGETDSTSGIWKPKTAPSVTYGTNGFFLKFENSGNMDLDSSGNNLSFTTAGTLTQNVDTPSNNFATMNSLDNYIASGTFANGNNTVTTVNTGYTYNTATMGFNKGKWYWECKWSAQPTGSTNQVLIGIAKRTSPSTTTWLGSVAYTYAYQGTGTVHNSDTTIATYTTMSVGDIIGVALDLDNNRLYFSKNGTWQGSSDPANGTNPISITAPDSTSGDSGFYFPAFGDGNNNLQETGQFNFGQGYFGTTSVASANADANGNGIMEYSVPSGYYTLNTKNIKEFG